MKEKYFQQNGFTLIELIIAIFLMGVVISIASAMLVQSFNVFESSTRRMSASQLAELTKREVSSYLRSAITGVSNGGNTWKFRAFHPNPDYDSPKDFEITHENGRIILNVKNVNGGIIESRVLVNAENIEFNINSDNNGDWDGNFDIYVKTEDEQENTASKTFSVRSRNYLDVDNNENE